ncbi:MAG: hypothetical protein IIY78_07905, partial [Clostridia bacterium]|nr:hypothetical protein [Clostridia bacterium]
MRPRAVPSSCIVNGSLRRTINFTSSRQLSGGHAAGMRPRAVPSSCIVSDSLRRTINFTSSRQLSGGTPLGSGSMPPAP